MKRNATLALGLCLEMLGTPIEAQEDNCQYLRASIAETRIPSNDQFGRLLDLAP